MDQPRSVPRSWQGGRYKAEVDGDGVTGQDQKLTLDDIVV
jgi:hypothetical protein